MAYTLIGGALLILIAIALFITGAVVEESAYIYYIIASVLLVIGICLVVYGYLDIQKCSDLTGRLRGMPCNQLSEIHQKCAKEFEYDIELESLYKNVNTQCF